jgi:hypothetical protein
MKCKKGERVIPKKGRENLEGEGEAIIDVDSGQVYRLIRRQRTKTSTVQHHN